MSNPEIKFCEEKKLVGRRLTMSFTENKTAELWKSFMPFRNQISKRINQDLISMQIYDVGFFEIFQPDKHFEKWAAVEVSEFENLPSETETFVLPAGLYAVFQQKGMGTEIFREIFTEWIPASDYKLDNRPHFEILGEKYKNNSPDSEEEIWIPVKSK